MAESQRLQIPEFFLGTEIPADLRRSLDHHAHYLEEDEAKSLVAAALASWVITTTAQKQPIIK